MTPFSDKNTRQIKRVDKETNKTEVVVLAKHMYGEDSYQCISSFENNSKLEILLLKLNTSWTE